MVLYNEVRVRASNGAIGVGYADNLSYSATPVALADSDARLLQTAASTDSGIDAGAGNGTDNDTGSTTGTDSINNGTRISPNGSSPSGCSIGSNVSDPPLPLIGLLAGLFVWRRRVV